jgi:hypothetical protein
VLDIEEHNGNGVHMEDGQVNKFGYHRFVGTGMMNEGSEQLLTSLMQSLFVVLFGLFNIQ